MIETIQIKTRSALIVAKQSKRTYFTVTDGKDRKFLCFNQSAFNEMPVGAGVAVEITERGDQTPTIDLIKESAAAPVATPAAAETPTKKPQPIPSKPDAFGEGQRQGMWYKELGEIIRADQMVKMFGKENAITIIKAYRAELLGVVKPPFDGDKLPQWKNKSPAE